MKKEKESIIQDLQYILKSTSKYRLAKEIGISWPTLTNVIEGKGGVKTYKLIENFLENRAAGNINKNKGRITSKISPTMVSGEAYATASSLTRIMNQFESTLIRGNRISFFLMSVLIILVLYILFYGKL